MQKTSAIFQPYPVVIENFCRASNLEEFRFPETPIGWFAYSEEKCPDNLLNGK